MTTTQLPKQKYGPGMSKSTHHGFTGHNKWKFHIADHPSQIGNSLCTKQSRTNPIDPRGQVTFDINISVQSGSRGVGMFKPDSEERTPSFFEFRVDLPPRSFYVLTSHWAGDDASNVVQSHKWKNKIWQMVNQNKVLHSNSKNPHQEILKRNKWEWNWIHQKTTQ